MAGMSPMTVPVEVVAVLPWAWEHQCGHLQKGLHAEGAFCGGCRFETKTSEIQQFLLVRTDGEQ